MVWTFILLIIILTVATISHPLFWNNLQRFSIPLDTDYDLNQANFLLSELSDLEEDFLFGRISNIEYEKQKIFIQRSYLEFIKGTDSK